MSTAQLMKRTRFFLLFATIIIGSGVLLRLHDYARVPPFGETRDEFAYPWAGMTLIKNGVPSSWSYFESYKNRHSQRLWNQEFRIVTPWFDKPLLYPLLTGGFMHLTGARDFADVQLTNLRLIPIILSFFTLTLIILIGTRVFSPTVGLTAGLIYAITPTFVLANRLSLSENLLTPIMLASLLVFLNILKKPSLRLSVILGLLCGLAFLTKQIGLVTGLIFALLLFLLRFWRALVTMLTTYIILILVHFALMYRLDWPLYWQVMSDFRIAHTLSGLPEVIFAIFQYPGLGQKDRPFPDGTVLLGWLLFFRALFQFEPFPTKIRYTGSGALKIGNSILQNSALFLKNITTTTQFAFLALPFAYLVFLVLVESGAAPYAYFGWHIYPLYPFLAVILGATLVKLYDTPRFLGISATILILFSSTLRFILLTLPREVHYLWQYVFVGFVIIYLLGWSVINGRPKKMFLLALFMGYVLANFYVVLNLKQIYYPLPPV